jgi:16S rRNA (uracil1498-N3)-methyltransferase
MQRLYVENNLVSGLEMQLEGDKAHYLLHVLRMKAGDELLLFNGREGEFLAQFVSATKKFITLKTLHQTREQTAQGKVHYAFSPLKTARLDYMVQKAVEMGVGQITPVITDYTQLHRLKAERLHANAIEAAEQCGVLYLPKINEILPLEKFISHYEGTLIFCDEHAPQNSAMAALSSLKGEVCVLIGPEGGFSPLEREKLLSLPYVTRLCLGSTILRADTAAVAALALVNEAIGSQ